jgi:peptide deformylase
MADTANQNEVETLREVDPSGLVIVKYPDPRLQAICTPLAKVDDSIRAVIDRMFKLMFDARGVGLAAPQVGLAVRVFVASPTFDAGDRRVYINPELLASDGVQDGEEGCLSFPGITCKVKRKKIVTVRAMDRDGNVFEETGEDLAARIFQHEVDHLDGRLLIDRMGTVAKLANRRALRELEEAFTDAQ